jgi:hypothetical protein
MRSLADRLGFLLPSSLPLTSWTSNFSARRDALWRRRGYLRHRRANEDASETLATLQVNTSAARGGQRWVDIALLDGARGATGVSQAQALM